MSYVVFSYEKQHFDFAKKRQLSLHICSIQMRFLLHSVGLANTESDKEDAKNAVKPFGFH